MLIASELLSGAANTGSQTAKALFKLNMALVALGYPLYHKGGPNFDERYRIYPTPRIVWSWWPMGLRLEEIYLSYLPETSEQVDFVYNDSSGKISVAKSPVSTGADLDIEV